MRTGRCRRPCVGASPRASLALVCWLRVRPAPPTRARRPGVDELEIPTPTPGPRRLRRRRRQPVVPARAGPHVGPTTSTGAGRRRHRDGRPPRPGGRGRRQTTVRRVTDAGARHEDVTDWFAQDERRATSGGSAGDGASGEAGRRAAPRRGLGDGGATPRVGDGYRPGYDAVSWRTGPRCCRARRRPQVAAGTFEDLLVDRGHRPRSSRGWSSAGTTPRASAWSRETVDGGLDSVELVASTGGDLAPSARTVSAAGGSGCARRRAVVGRPAAAAVAAAGRGPLLGLLVPLPAASARAAPLLFRAAGPPTAAICSGVHCGWSYCRCGSATAMARGRGGLRRLVPLLLVLVGRAVARAPRRRRRPKREAGAGHRLGGRPNNRG